MRRASTSRRSTGRLRRRRGGAWRGAGAGRARRVAVPRGNGARDSTPSPAGSPTPRRSRSPTGRRRSRAASGCSIPPSARRCSPRSLRCSRRTGRRAGSCAEQLARRRVCDRRRRRRATRAFDGEGVASAAHPARRGRGARRPAARPRRSARRAGGDLDRATASVPRSACRRARARAASSSRPRARRRARRCWPASRRGLFASALTAPLRVDLAGRPLRDRVHRRLDRRRAARRARSPERASRGRVSELLRRIAGRLDGPPVLPVAVPGGLADAPVERASFD